MSKKKISLAISPCPNDTYIFGAMLLGYVEIPGIELEVNYLDIAALNDSAIQERYDITKISYYCYTKLTESYYLLDSGGALGHNCGPLLISKHPFETPLDKKLKVAIPGKNTTANMLLTLAQEQLDQKSEHLFSEIESTLIDDKADLGLIIHENRFTYESKGLSKIMDLGSWWETSTNCPIPLGAILAHKEMDPEDILKIDKAIYDSIVFADNNTHLIMDYILEHAQEMERKVVLQHIQLYVNEYSKSLGSKGKRAVNTLFDALKKKNLINSSIFPSYYNAE